MTVIIPDRPAMSAEKVVQYIVELSVGYSLCSQKNTSI